MSNPFDFSAALRQLKNDDVKQTVIALVAGVSPPKVSRWINNGAQYSPSVEELRRMRDSRHLPAWFRQACAEATSAGQRVDAAEREVLDVDGDGVVTLNDYRIWDRQRNLVAAQRAVRIEEAMAGGVLSADEFAEQRRLWAQEQDLGAKVARVMDILDGQSGGPRRQLL